MREVLQAGGRVSGKPGAVDSDDGACAAPVIVGRLDPPTNYVSDGLDLKRLSCHDFLSRLPNPLRVLVLSIGPRVPWSWTDHSGCSGQVACGAAVKIRDSPNASPTELGEDRAHVDSDLAG